MGVDSLIKDIATVAKENPVTTAVGAIGVAAGVGLGTAAIVGAVKRRKTKRRKTRNTRKRSRSRRKLKFGSRAYRKKYLGKRRHTKRTSHRRIRYTKRGQPYIIKPNGRALFISKKGARISRRRKGGRY